MILLNLKNSESEIIPQNLITDLILKDFYPKAIYLCTHIYDPIDNYILRYRQDNVNFWTRL